jgi:hypothetical protein
MAEHVAVSVDLEPNKDGSLDGVRDAMAWFDRAVPRGTVFATYRIATELPELLVDLADAHEIGVHVHPREFGHDHDQLAELPASRQRELIAETRTAITDAVGREPTSFRAGRHSASRETISVLSELGFAVDASVNVRYADYFPKNLTERTEPFELDGLTELPVTHGTLPVVSRCGLRGLAERPVTATAATLRTDRLGCTGLSAVDIVLRNATVGSFYMHPYDATEYHRLPNVGETYRRRFESLLATVDSARLCTATEVAVE